MPLCAASPAWTATYAAPDHHIPVDRWMQECDEVDAWTHGMWGLTRDYREMWDGDIRCSGRGIACVALFFDPELGEPAFDVAHGVCPSEAFVQSTHRVKCTTDMGRQAVSMLVGKGGEVLNDISAPHAIAANVAAPWAPVPPRHLAPADAKIHAEAVWVAICDHDPGNPLHDAYVDAYKRRFGFEPTKVPRNYTVAPCDLAHCADITIYHNRVHDVLIIHGGDDTTGRDPHVGGLLRDDAARVLGQRWVDNYTLLLKREAEAKACLDANRRVGFRLRDDAVRVIEAEKAQREAARRIDGMARLAAERNATPEARTAAREAARRAAHQRTAECPFQRDLAAREARAGAPGTVRFRRKPTKSPEPPKAPNGTRAAASTASSARRRRGARGRRGGVKHRQRRQNRRQNQRQDQHRNPRQKDLPSWAPARGQVASRLPPAPASPSSPSCAIPDVKSTEQFPKL